MNSFSPILCKKWNSFLLNGFFLLTLGTLALVSSFLTTMVTVMFLGALLIAASISLIVHAFWANDWSGFFSQIAVGTLSAIIGWIMFMNPAISAASITLFLALFFIAAGIVKLASALFLTIEHKGWFLLNGLITLGLGIAILAQWPTSALWLLGMFIGIDLVVSGWSSIMFSLAVRKRCKLEGKETT